MDSLNLYTSKEITGISDLNPKRILGIDIGVRNIITIGNNISEKGIAVRGGVLKSINQYFISRLWFLLTMLTSTFGSYHLLDA